MNLYTYVRTNCAQWQVKFLFISILVIKFQALAWFLAKFRNPNVSSIYPVFIQYLEYRNENSGLIKSLSTKVLLANLNMK